MPALYTASNYTGASKSPIPPPLDEPTSTNQETQYRSTDEKVQKWLSSGIGKNSLFVGSR